MHAYKSYIFVVSRSEGRATQRLPSRDVLAQAFKVFTHAQLITRLYVAGKARVPRLDNSYGAIIIIYGHMPCALLVVQYFGIAESASPRIPSKI